MNIEYIGRDAIVSTPDVAFTYQVSDTVRDSYALKQEENTLDWSNHNNMVGDYIVYPYGSNNNLPEVIKRIVQTNYIAPGIIKKKTQLLWGLGPKLYIENFKNGVLSRDWVDDDEIEAWLNSWDYECYLIKAVTDYHYLEGVFSRYELTKAIRIGGKPFISRIVHSQPDRTRLASLKTNEERIPTHVLVNDKPLSNINQINYKVYPLFDFLAPFATANSILYSNMYSFCTDYYTVPDIYGSLEWLNRSTAVPLIFKALSENSLNIKYHIVSPQKYWDKQKENIETNCRNKGVVYNYKMLEEYQSLFLRKISEVLSGNKNVGKYLHTTKEFFVDGTNLVEHGWEIKVIDQNIKDYVDSQINISQRADHAVSAGFGLHSALGNVSETGKSDSGSEQLYALKNYLLTGIDIPELIIMKAINYAIQANFPSKKLKLGFYHLEPQREQDITAKDRVTNQV